MSSVVHSSLFVHRRHAHTTSDPSKVTCTRCREALDTGGHPRHDKKTNA